MKACNVSYETFEMTNARRQKFMPVDFLLWQKGKY